MLVSCQVKVDNLEHPTSRNIEARVSFSETVEDAVDLFQCECLVRFRKDEAINLSISEIRARAVEKILKRLGDLANKDLSQLLEPQSEL